MAESLLPLDGNSDATLLTPEEKVSAERFDINVLFDLRKLGIEFLIPDVVTTRTFVKQEPEATRRFMKGLSEGVHYYKTHKKESIDIMAKYLRTTDRKIIEVGVRLQFGRIRAKTYSSLKAGQLALGEIARRNPEGQRRQS